MGNSRMRRTDENTNVAYTTQVSLPPPFADRIRALADDDAAVEAAAYRARDLWGVNGARSLVRDVLHTLADQQEGA